MNNIHLYHGPKMEKEVSPINPLTQRSAAFCTACTKRRVQTLVFKMPVMTSDMHESSLMAAAFCGPQVYWQCPCGELLYSNMEIEGW